jgi:asparagine synthase (glutamine-hydrolysing)
MCGILGIYDSDPVENFRIVCPELLQRINYRGPDDEGNLFLDSRGKKWGGKGPGIYLGHKRLSIIDLSESGHQPMSNEDNSLWVVFNGEIYNYLEIREELIKKGHRFKSMTDTEVLLHGYETWEIGLLERLRGMFAFCIYDVRRGRFFIARDRMGQKPFVFSRGNRFFGFSSELKSLYTYPKIKRDVSPKAIHYFLTYQYIPHKHTIFKDISKLPSAHYGIYNTESDSFFQRRYWNPPFFVPGELPEKKHGKKHEEELQALISDSVRLRLRSDVPLGIFLSGGVDSSTMAYFAKQQLSQPPETFSISFAEQEFDESRYATLVAQALGTRHHAFTVKSEGLRILPELIWYYNEPFGDSSMIPTYYVSKVTAEHVKVVLSGDGGDEVFLGYNRYLLYVTLKKMYNLFKILPVETLKSVFKFLSNYQTFKRYPGMLYNFFSRIESREILHYANYVTIIHDNLKEELYTPSFKEVAHPAKAMKLVNKLFDFTATYDVRQAFSRVDFQTYLPGDILTKVDIASMANSLECRSPLLDHKIVEFAVRLSPDEKLSLFKGKKILKKVMKNKIPKEILKRPKMGFGVPINRWFREEKWARLLREILLDPMHIRRGYFVTATIQRLIDEHVRGVYDRSAILWQLLVLELWHQTFVRKDPKPFTLP